jgi:hypothetical protein
MPRLQPAVQPAAFISAIQTSAGPLEIRDRYIPGQGVIREAVGGGPTASAPAPSQRADGSFGYDLLALSGGGSNGAFGAGVLSGWTQVGTRPNFAVVTGISTGSLLSSFAFAGPEFDPQLRQAFTTIQNPNIFRRNRLVQLPWSDSLFRADPLEDLIGTFADARLLEAVAEGHRQGRRLYVGSTDLDQKRLIIWDMGSIAACGHPGAPELYRKVLRASSSIPVLFDPMEFQVSARGGWYSELHVDGGTRASLFMRRALVSQLGEPLAQARAGAEKTVTDDAVRRTRYDTDETIAPEEIDPKDEIVDRRLDLYGSRLFIIVNGKLRPEPAATDRGLVPIAAHSIQSLMSAQFNGELYRMYLLTASTGMAFRMVAIPEEQRNVSSPAEFNPDAMTLLFELGRGMADRGIAWIPAPRGIDESEVAILEAARPRRESDTRLARGDEKVEGRPSPPRERARTKPSAATDLDEGPLPPAANDIGFAEPIGKPPSSSAAPPPP